MVAGYSLLIDLIGGSMERMLVTPLNRTATLIGWTTKEFAVLPAQAALIIVLATPLGFRPHPTGVPGRPGGADRVRGRPGRALLRPRDRVQPGR